METAEQTLARLRGLAQTGTAENFLACDDDTKRLSFALLIDESSRRKEAEARAETAERLLGEVVGALEPFAKIADHLTPGAYGPAWGFNGGVIEHEDFRRAREALSKVSEEGFSSSQGSVEGPGCVPAANHDAVLDNVRPEIREEVAYALRLAAEGAASSGPTLTAEEIEDLAQHGGGPIGALSDDYCAQCGGPCLRRPRHGEGCW